MPGLCLQFCVPGVGALKLFGLQAQHNLVPHLQSSWTFRVCSQTVQLRVTAGSFPFLRYRTGSHASLGPSFHFSDMVRRASEGYWDGQLQLSAWQYPGTRERWCGKTQPDWEQDYSLKRDHGLFKMEKVSTQNCSLCVSWLWMQCNQLLGAPTWLSYHDGLPRHWTARRSEPLLLPS